MVVYIIMMIISIYLIYKSVSGIYNITINQSRFNKSHKKYKDLTDKIFNFLHDETNFINYSDKLDEYFKILNLPLPGNKLNLSSDIDEYIAYYENSYNKLFDMFKDIIPDLIQEEREKKLDKILVN